MKTLFLILVFFACGFGLYSQNAYNDAMIGALEGFGKANTIDELQAVASQFDRIAAVETKEWLPAYYSSLIYSIIVFRLTETDKKEGFALKAQQQIERAMSIAPRESEIYALQGMVYQTFMAIDPMKNGQIYAPKMNGALQMAMKLNPENPRPYYLQGITTMYTPEEFGGGKVVAKPLFEKAMEKFNNFTKPSDIYPDWGKEDCEKNLALCIE